MTDKKRAIAIVSGGLDSVILAHGLPLIVSNVVLDLIISFDYGQRHKKELVFAEKAAGDLGVEWAKIYLGNFAPWMKENALCGDVEVPDGHYEEDSMKVTVVPNRNAIMLSIAAGIASSRRAEYIAVATHAGDHHIYADCRPEFIRAFQSMLDMSLQGGTGGGVEVLAPFIEWSKAAIVYFGAKLTPLDDTWSCYKGGDIHCGVCGTCVERKEAFVNSKIFDPTAYKE